MIVLTLLSFFSSMDWYCVQARVPCSFAVYFCAIACKEGLSRLHLKASDSMSEDVRGRFRFTDGVYANDDVKGDQFETRLVQNGVIVTERPSRVTAFNLI
jgi:hypothetical protein